MGNVLRRGIDSDGHVDGGAFTLNEGADTRDYNEYIIRRLIIARRLAPFYDGIADGFEEQDQETDNNSEEDSLSEDEASGRSPNRLMRIFRFRKRWSLEEKERIMTEVKKYVSEYHSECPICLLHYPKNINKTSCCSQNICTRCFINIRRPPSGRVISCPFCNYMNFSIKYLSPKSKFKGKRLDGSKEVYCEAVKAYRAPPPVAGPAVIYQHAVPQSQRYIQYAGPSFSVRNGTNMTTYGGVRVLYDQNGRAYYVPVQQWHIQGSQRMDPSFRQVPSLSQQQTYRPPVQPAYVYPAAATNNFYGAGNRDYSYHGMFYQ